MIPRSPLGRYHISKEHTASYCKEGGSMFFGNAGTHLSVYKVSDLENSYLINVGNLKNLPCHSPCRRWLACFRLFCVPWKEKSICSVFKQVFYALSINIPLRYTPEGRAFDSRWCHWNSSLTEYFRPYYGPGVDSASNKNECQECFLGA